MDPTLVGQYVVNGLVFGSLLALAGIGLSLVYGILGLANFAHADFLTLGAFAAFVAAGAMLGTLDVALLGAGVFLLLAAALDAGFTKKLSTGERVAAGSAGAVALVLGALLLAGVGMDGSQATLVVLLAATALAVVVVVVALLAFEYVVWRPLRRRRATSLTLIIVSIGVSLVVRNLLLARFGGGIHSFQRPGEVSPVFLGVRVSEAEQLTMLVALLLILGVHLFLKLTRAGKAMRALSDNADLARVSGVDVDRMVVYVWILSGALLAVSGVLMAFVRNNALDAQMGAGVIVALFAAVIVGGIGSAYGAMLGGLLIGVAMKTTALWIGTEYEMAAAFGALILVLVVRPQGILGVKAG